jgi:hypothetical protein
MKVRDRGRVATTEAREHGCLGMSFLGQLPVELATGGMAYVRARLTGMTAVVGRTGSNGNRCRCLGIPVPDLFAKIGVIWHLTTS